MSGVGRAELEAQLFELLPHRNTLALIKIGPLTLLEGVRILEGSNIAAIGNVLTGGNTTEVEEN